MFVENIQDESHIMSNVKHYEARENLIIAVKDVRKRF